MALVRGSERSNVFALITPKQNAAAVLIMSCLLMVGSLCAAETEAPAPDSASETTPSESLPPDVIAAKLSAQVAAQQLEAKRLADKNPLEAIELLDSTAETVAAETVLPEATRQLLGRRIQTHSFRR